jgi:ubiquinone/menaquinone biosynthesis C-methylase UbiE
MLPDRPVGLPDTGLATEIGSFLDAWAECILRNDAALARGLRTLNYSCTMPDGRVMSLDDEIKTIESNSAAVTAINIDVVEIKEFPKEVVVSLLMSIHCGAGGGIGTYNYKGDIALVKEDGQWRARSLYLQPSLIDNSTSTRPLSTWRKLRLLGRKVRNAGAMPLRSGGFSFQNLAYIPYRSDQDYALPLSVAAQNIYDEHLLPVPPQDLWLGYNYPAHGALHVQTMLDIAQASGCSFSNGDKLLDLGCGAGRMIRHLAPLARDLEIWGADISAEHIYWCQRNLSPPFHFFTNTKVPHLPLADGSFSFIYCGSLFTHIDDLARAWLLEIRRVIKDSGCVYITIHDENTVRLFDAYRSPPPIVEYLRSRPIFDKAKMDSDIFTIGRDERSQVFYTQEWFKRLLSPMFDVVSVTPESYFYQTGVLIRPSSK